MNTNILDELLSATPYELHELRHDLRHRFVALNSVYNDDGSIDLVRKHEHERLVALNNMVDKLLEVGQTRTTVLLLC